jgi:outer membrane lipoprotein-sorting protein
VANNKKDSFVGSDFSYGDVLLPRVDLFLHTLLRMETINGQQCYVIESRPRDEKIRQQSGYGRKISWVRDDNYVEAKVQYFDVTGDLLKTQITSNYKLAEPDTGRWLALKREMTNHKTGHSTVIEFTKIAPGVSLKDDVFTTRSIERQ